MAFHRIIPEDQRFWSKVVVNQEKIFDGRPCWEWTGAISRGYGIFRGQGKGGRAYKAHRWAYEYLVGPIPEGLESDHLCRNRRCVNPWHIEPVTRRVNVLRGSGVSSQNAAKLFCKNGHPLTGQNVYIRPNNGSRMCRACGTENRRSTMVSKGPCNYKGSANPASKMTEQDVIRIRSERLHKSTAQIVRENPQWSWSAVWQAITGYSWAHLPGAVPQNRKCDRFNYKQKKGKTTP